MMTAFRVWTWVAVTVLAFGSIGVFGAFLAGLWKARGLSADAADKSG